MGASTDFTEKNKDCQANYQGLYDKNGRAIDVNGNAVGWAERSGELMLINGQRLMVKQLMVEIIIPKQANPVAQYNFADQPLLRNVALWSLQFYTSTDFPISPISKNPVVTATMAAYAFLWMQQYANSYNFFQNKPCVDLTSAKTTPEGMIGQHVNWPNGYVVFSDITIGGTNPFQSAAYSILIGVNYSLMNNYQMDGLGSTFGLR
jgi:hypothetical protein